MEQEQRTRIIYNTKSASYVPSRLYAKYIPFGIPFDMLGSYFLLLPILYLLPLDAVSVVYRYGLLPIAITFAIFKVKLNYQAPWLYIPKLINNLFTKKNVYLVGFQKESRSEFDTMDGLVTLYQPYKMKRTKRKTKKRKTRERRQKP